MRRRIGVLVCITVLLSCTTVEDPERTLDGKQIAQPTPGVVLHDRHPNWPLRSNERFGIAMQLPPSWSLVWRPLRDGTIGDIVLVGSWRFSDLSACARIPPGQALISLNEVSSVIASSDYNERQLARSFPPTPRRFEITVLRRLEMSKGCDQPEAQLFSFGESGRYLYAWAMFGRNHSTGVRKKAEAVLSMVRVQQASTEVMGEADGPAATMG
jgi:hypothetical protein